MWLMEHLKSHCSKLSPQSTPGGGTTTGGGPTLNPEAPSFSSSLMLTVANQSILLQTALINIYNQKQPHKLTRVGLILDSIPAFQVVLKRHCILCQKMSVSWLYLPLAAKEVELRLVKLFMWGWRLIKDLTLSSHCWLFHIFASLCW